MTTVRSLSDAWRHVLDEKTRLQQKGQSLQEKDRVDRKDRVKYLVLRLASLLQQPIRTCPSSTWVLMHFDQTENWER